MMIEPTHSLHHGIASRLVSENGQQQPSQSFTTELSEEIARRGSAGRATGNLPANFAVGQQNATRLDSGTTTNTTTQPVESFDDAYWAKQPAAVQQLRNIQDPSQRAATAAQLAGKGYSIDVPIMVWGWDPQITTQARESLGYTWVPSALQQPVEVAPGLSFNGTSYDPLHPPAGSIPV